MKYLYDRFEDTLEYRKEVVEIIKHNVNVELGGYKIYDGIGTHLMQNPHELTDFIFYLKRTGKHFNRFLEVGLSAGINNTILNKFMKFDEVVAVDNMAAQINGYCLKANLMHKNITVVCGDSTSSRVIDIVGKLGKYDLIFIDAGHTYELVSQDFKSYSPLLNKGGVIAFHDVDCPDWPGIHKFWNELKDYGLYDWREFVYRGNLQQLGIGAVRRINDRKNR